MKQCISTDDNKSSNLWRTLKGYACKLWRMATFYIPIIKGIIISIKNKLKEEKEMIEERMTFDGRKEYIEGGEENGQQKCSDAEEK